MQQISRQCPACQRTIKVGRYGKFLPHFFGGRGKWESGRCIGSGLTVNETKERVENA